jgi:hypothetical protein
MVLISFNHTRVPIDLEAKAGSVVLLFRYGSTIRRTQLCCREIRETIHRALREEPFRFHAHAPDSNNPRA